MQQPQELKSKGLMKTLGILLTLALLTSCDLLFIPQIFPPQMDLLAPSDTLWLRSGRDSLNLEFRIQDEDGDLGRDSLDQTKDLWMLEVRYGSPAFDSTYTEYVIPNLTPKGADKRLNASLKIQVDPLTLRSGLSVDSSQFYVVLRDRAGNFCPVIALPMIYLRP
jgi:hypothetical protein